MATKKVRPAPKISKTVAAIGVGAGLLEGKANKWALYGLALALLTCLSAWGMREVVHTKTKHSLESSLNEATTAKKALAKDYVITFEQLTQVQAELQQSKSAKARHQGGRKIQRPNGEIEETWFDEQSETLETLSQTLQELSQVKARVTELEQQLESSEQVRLAQQKELQTLSHKVVKRAGGMALSASYDLDSSRESFADKAKLGAGVWMGPWTIGASFRPSYVFKPSYYGGSNEVQWDRLDPSLEAELRF